VVIARTRVRAYWSRNSKEANEAGDPGRRGPGLTRQSTRSGNQPEQKMHLSVEILPELWHNSSRWYCDQQTRKRTYL